MKLKSILYDQVKFYLLCLLNVMKSYFVCVYLLYVLKLHIEKKKIQIRPYPIHLFTSTMTLQSWLRSISIPPASEIENVYT